MIAYILASISDIGTGEWLGLLLTLTITLAGACYKFGEKASRLIHVENDIKDTIKPSIRNIEQKLDEVLKTVTLRQVAESHSPRALNDFGKRVRDESDVRSIIGPQLQQLVNVVRQRNPENAYQVQEYLLDTIQELYKDTSLKGAIEQAAFKSGVSVETLLVVAGIDIRDTVLDSLGMRN